MELAGVKILVSLCVSQHLYSTGCFKIKYLNTKLQYLRNALIFIAPNLAHLSGRSLCTSALFCADFTSHTPKWQKC